MRRKLMQSLVLLVALGTILNSLLIVSILPMAAKASVPDVTITEFPVPTSNSIPFGITHGNDGNLWFTENYANKIGKITPSGTFTEFPVPTSNSVPFSITQGNDGDLWFTESYVDKIGNITPSG